MKVLRNSLVFFCLISCSTSPRLDWDGLIRLYSKNSSDSIKKEAVIFLRDNGADLISENPIFEKNKSKQEINIGLDTITSEESLRQLLSNDINSHVRILNDSLLLSNGLIRENIEMAFAIFNKYPWNQNIPKDVFLNYLLPYKVFREKPGNWRKILFERYKKMLPEEQTRYIQYPNLDLTTFFKNIFKQDSLPIFTYNPKALKLSDFPGIDELLAVKGGDCLQGSIINVYILRSLGIPAAVDVIPLWGKGNSGHVTQVFWNPIYKKMTTSIGDGLTPPGRAPAKVFRYSFKNQNAWSKIIMPKTDSSFCLSFLKNDHWLDVTSDHVPVSTLKIPIKKYVGKYAYICVFNYGTWSPIYWGSKNTEGFVFENMGRDILYKIAMPTSSGYTLTNPTFLLDTLGNLSEVKINTSKKIIDMKLQKINWGDASWVKKGEQYILQILTPSGTWSSYHTQTCTKDLLIGFKNVYANNFYRLISKGSNERLERPFRYEKGLQIWY